MTWLNHMTDTPDPKDQELREELLSLKRPDKFYTGETIEATLDDLLALIKTHEKALLDRVLERKELLQYLNSEPRTGQVEAVPVEAIKTLQEGLCTSHH